MRYLVVGLLLLAAPVMAHPVEKVCIAYAELEEREWAPYYRAVRNKIDPNSSRVSDRAKRSQWADEIRDRIWQGYWNIYTGRQSELPGVMERLIVNQRQECRDLYGL